MFFVFKYLLPEMVNKDEYKNMCPKSTVQLKSECSFAHRPYSKSNLSYEAWKKHPASNKTV